VVVVCAGCVVVVVVWEVVGAGTTSVVVVGCAGGFTVVWEQAENRPRAMPARAGRVSFFIGDWMVVETH
jgi:hypothetical protein